ncbi:MAG: hypothetical protein IPG42_20220 [Betaproteobacteria bacterium]|nr:hypothetical protein [Betaproteobacteria bacterium]
MIGGFLQELRWFLMIASLAIFAVVFVVMFVSIWRHHRSGETENFHASVAVELCWALAPFLIVVLMVLPTTRVLMNR